MNNGRPTTYQKARQINLDAARHGTFAEIGAGQEVARWFFHVGGAAATVATTISAYDMAVSDALYGASDRYVSRRRLQAMLDREYAALLQQLGGKRGATSSFFVFADTVAARSYGHPEPGHGWMGIRFQDHPGAAPSEIVMHVGLLDTENVREQDALGILGVNLIHGAFYHAGDPAALMPSLLDDLSRERVEIDMIRFCGPRFSGIDNRLMSLQLVEQGFTDAAMFLADGEVVQPGDVLHGKAVLIERGSFRPVTRVTADMLRRAADRFQADLGGSAEPPVVIMEMSLRNLLTGDRLDHEDFLARVDVLSALGATVMISRSAAHYPLVASLRRYTPRPIGFALGIPTLRALFDERYYADLGGGILEGLGRLFQAGVTLYGYPHREQAGALTTVESLPVPAPLRLLYAFLCERRRIVPIRDVDESALHILPRDVLARLQAGDPSWESLVPEPAARVIKARGLFAMRPADTSPAAR